MMLKIKSSNYIEEFKKTRAVSQKYFSTGPTTIVDETFIGVGVPKKIVWEDDSIRGILSSEGRVAALSFADADIPGGLVWQGVKTQEEDLCRSSNLYEYLIKEEIPFYNNHKPGGFKAMIHKDVTFFRDSNLQWLPPDKIKKCDIISCPAQIYPSTLELETKKRMRCILWLAADADVLVLGRYLIASQSEVRMYFVAIVYFCLLVLLVLVVLFYCWYY